MILKEEMVGDRYGQRIFASACFGPTKKTRSSVLRPKGERDGVAAV